MNFHDTYGRLLREVLFNGNHVAPRGKPTLELEDVVFTLEPSSDDAFVHGRTSLRYLLAEMAWYASRDRSVAWIKTHASLWGYVSNPDGTANSNYGEKLWDEPGPVPTRHIQPSEWVWARDSLLRDPLTRQAVMVIHRPEHHWHANKDVPCTLTLSFTVRDGMLKMRAHMRSSDAWYGLPYDVPFFRWAQRRMASQLNQEGLDVRVGQLRVMLDSLHVYAEKESLARAYLDRWQPAASWVNPIPPDLPLDAVERLAMRLLEAGT